jgi:hypothetical protein
MWLAENVTVFGCTRILTCSSQSRKMCKWNLQSACTEMKRAVSYSCYYEYKRRSFMGGTPASHSGLSVFYYFLVDRASYFRFIAA